MANFKNTFYDFVTGKQTLPASSNKTGTISTQGTSVTGVGTDFYNDMPSGSWLVDLTQNELRQVVLINSATEAVLAQAFTSSIAAGTTPNVIHKKDLGISEISVQIPSGQADGLIDNKTFPAGIGASFSKSSRDNSAGRDLIDPIIVDATGTQMIAMIIR